jgi:cell division protein FtsI (penicillin-binding protein 3)
VPELGPEAWRRTVRGRLTLVLAFFGLWAAAAEARLVYLQVLQHDAYVARAERQHKRTVEVPAKRGEIVDRNDRVLAFSVDADSIYAVPSEIREPDRIVASLCAALERCDAEFRAGLRERLGRRRAFVWVKRQVSPAEARRVAALDVEGVGFLKENRRFYPNTTLGAHVVGYVGLDNQGLGGIEAAYNALINGRAGTSLIQTDARRHAFSRVERPPTTGASVQLTIDEVLQWIAERELRAGVLEHRARGGSAIIMDPWTGEILAMANEPTFNPNAFAAVADTELLKNRAVQDIYEPGSTFKIVTASAALQENVIKPTDVIDVSQGLIAIGSRRVRDTHRYGPLTFEDVIVKSSNVGAIKVGFRIGPERLGRYVRRFGFGSVLSPDLRGESPGIVWSQLNDSALASVSMGYQIGVTPLQMVTAASSVANGGRLMEPHLVRAIIRDGRRAAMPPKVLRETITLETAAELTTIMEGVVERGTAKAARIDGFTIAGKTGTAAKLVHGVYSKSEYMSSFVGFLPSRKPVVSILVVIDSPRRGSYFGGAVAAPVFKRIAEAAIRHLGVPRTLDPDPPVLVRRELNAPAVSPRVVSGPRDVVTASVPSNDAIPDVHGLSARDAVKLMVRLGLRPRINGDGVVVNQRPDAGTPLEQANHCELWLERAPRPQVVVDGNDEDARP